MVIVCWANLHGTNITKACGGWFMNYDNYAQNVSLERGPSHGISSGLASKTVAMIIVDGFIHSIDPAAPEHIPCVIQPVSTTRIACDPNV